MIAASAVRSADFGLDFGVDVLLTHNGPLLQLAQLVVRRQVILRLLLLKLFHVLDVLQELAVLHALGLDVLIKQSPLVDLRRLVPSHAIIRHRCRSTVVHHLIVVVADAFIPGDHR